LLDGVRVMVRLLAAGQDLPGAPGLAWHNHRRRAKKRARTIRYTRGKDKKLPLYRDLIEATQDTLGYLEHSAARLSASGTEVFALMAWQAEVERFVPLIAQVIDQTQRRVFNGESVPAKEKIVSLFEPHTDIIVKDRRDVHYGIEAGISCLKRAYGLARCTWKGLAHFKAYVWSSVVAHNLALLARLQPT
jgi:IS5 family transposase